ncbi:MAG: DUF4316 domain-containing protein [Oscillospiraceae bacterium]
MDIEISGRPGIDGLEVSRNDCKLPEGVVVSAGNATISDKNIALKLFDMDYPIFIIDKDGNSVYTENRTELELHSGMYSASEQDIYHCFSVTPHREEAIRGISDVTGYSTSRINALPDDVLMNVINVWLTNVNLSDASTLKDQLNAAIDCKPQTNHLKSIEELIECNPNSIDGIINNLPKGENERRSVLAEIKELRTQAGSPSDDKREITR